MPKISNKKTKDYQIEILESYINEFIKHLEKIHFSKSIIKKYKSSLHKFQTFCIQNQISSFFSDDTLEEYFKSIINYSPYGIKFSIKVINKFKDFSLTGSFKICYRKTVKNLTSIQFKKAFSSYSHSLEQSDIKNSTKNMRENIIFNFLMYLENNNILSFNKLSFKDITNYINSSNLAHSTKYTLSKQLKSFFNFTFKSNITSFSGDELFPRIKRNYNTRILSFYSTKEVETLISTIGTNSKNGKRNYAIILLATVLGMRASDIVNLKINDIDWDNKLIKIIQQKTQKPLIQPFPDEVFYALLDYLKNARPEINISNIFISSIPPFRALTSSSLSSMVDNYFKLTDIDISSRKHGIHSLRHSFANNMLHNNVSLQDISASLGHSYISTTLLYTNIDIITLKKLSLEVI